MIHRAVIQTVFQHMLVGAANHRSGLQTQEFHNLVAVHIRANGVEILFLLELANTRLHLIHRLGEHHRLALVLRSGIRASESV